MTTGIPRRSSGANIVTRYLTAEQNHHEDASLIAQWRWRPTDPYAIGMTIWSLDTSVHWDISRSLLAEGLHRPAGEGDVRITPGRRWCTFPAADPGEDTRVDVAITLSNGNGTTTLVFDGDELGAFLADTERVIPLGQEPAFIDLDTEITRILQDPPEAHAV